MYIFKIGEPQTEGKVEKQSILEKELKYSWDGERSRDILIVRRMNWDDPVEVYRDYGKRLTSYLHVRE